MDQCENERQRTYVQDVLVDVVCQCRKGIPRKERFTTCRDMTDGAPANYQDAQNDIFDNQSPLWPTEGKKFLEWINVSQLAKHLVAWQLASQKKTRAHLPAKYDIAMRSKKCALALAQQLKAREGRTWRTLGIEASCSASVALSDVCGGKTDGR